MTPEGFRASVEFVFGSVRRGAHRLGMHETTLKRMCGIGVRPGWTHAIPDDLASRVSRAERALRKIFSETEK
jgi:hypothetical protein